MVEVLKLWENKHLSVGENFFSTGLVHSQNQHLLLRIALISFKAVPPVDSEVGEHNSNFTRTYGRYIELVNGMINQQT